LQGKILVIRGGAIGDFILTLPAIAALRKQFPNAHLEVLGYPHIIQLALAGGLVDRIQSIEARALAGFFARGGDLTVDLVDYFSEFDLVVSYLYDPDEIFLENVTRCTSGQFVQGPHRPDEQGNLHATKVYLKPLERLAIFDADPLPKLRIERPAPGTTRMAARPLAAGARDITVALHPGSGSERKNWPEAQWVKLLEHLVQATNFSLLIVGGIAEGERLQRLAAALPPTRTRVAQSWPLVELAGELQRCSGFIGHDSGISHLAGAVGLPGLLLWADTSERIWRPPSPKMVVLRHPAGLGKLPVDMVVEELNRQSLQAYL
jgi:heptosyltransferase III